MKKIRNAILMSAVILLPIIGFASSSDNLGSKTVLRCSVHINGAPPHEILVPILSAEDKAVDTIVRFKANTKSVTVSMSANRMSPKEVVLDSTIDLWLNENTLDMTFTLPNFINKLPYLDIVELSSLSPSGSGKSVFTELGIRCE